MQLLINTGGKGTRLYPLTESTPKPMIKINNKPILEHLVDWAKKYWIEEIIMLNGYKSEIVEGYFKDGKKYGISIKHSTENEPLGSGGAIKLAKPLVRERFGYISGDLYCNVDFNELLNFHVNNKADLTCVVKRSLHPEDSDILKVNEKGRVIKFISKNGDHTGAGNLCNSGLCILEKDLLDLMEEDKFNFENYLYPKILEKNFKMYAYETTDLIEDIGTFQRLKEIEQLIGKK